MNLQRTRSTLWLTTLALAAAAAGLAAWHHRRPVDLPHNSAARSVGSDRTPDTAENMSPTADPAVLGQLAQRNYRQRLFDPPKVQPPPPPPQPVPPVQLISTILRAGGEASAWIKDGQTTRKVKVGDTVGPENNPATITVIEPDRLVLDHEGRVTPVTRETGGGRR